MTAVTEQVVTVENVGEGVRQLSEEAACELKDERSHGSDRSRPAALFCSVLVTHRALARKSRRVSS